ncbi:D-glycero-beta-D-manno-heptose 1-phosphate adenylyltransferase [Selenomonas sp. TAMA-11512]|uniref:D-glycero-beta-D-manno-heptose 1-phosphate adenylyltransferase n=1 Tax=Selenomonas sp. TAMA-11512 TaxID=3095337 RepID=UPI00308952DE|nr:D-glycero-beta-D-manno-heptose 1-phosphate adenylyltransferase [Selenomonas sp. TAMA-11512]
MRIPADKIEAFAATLKEAGAKVVFTNGCFDIVHAGHVRYLAAARALGDCLILGLNSDASVKRLKGESRPVNTELDRAEVVGALKSVDYVVLFEEDTAETLISKVRPNIYAKGGDYTRETLPEAKIVESYGGEVAFIDLVPGKSTTSIISAIERCGG